MGGLLSWEGAVIVAVLAIIAVVVAIFWDSKKNDTDG